MGLSYYMCVFLVARPFCWYWKFWPCDLDLDFWPTFEKKNLTLTLDIPCGNPCGKTSLSIPKILTVTLTYFWNNLTLGLTFEHKEIELSYYTWIYLIARPFCTYQNFWSHNLDLQLWPIFEKLNFEPIRKEIQRDVRSWGGILVQLGQPQSSFFSEPGRMSGELMSYP